MSPRVLMLFLDGVGIGRADASINPFFAANLSTLKNLLDGAVPHLRKQRIITANASLVPLNATLGVAGLPQSGTGQTSLFTGINAPKLIGRHFGPYPYSSLRPVISEHNIFRKLVRSGRKVFYANAYPQRYFDHLRAHRNRITATVMAWVTSGFSLNDYRALRRGRALAADVTNERWVKQGFGEVPILTPREAGERLASMLEQFHFVLYDFFFTDHAGHSQSMQQATEILEMLDEFVGGIRERLDPRHMTFLITSDHGNLEDLSTKSHTRNPVPLLVVGRRREYVSTRAKNLTQITPVIVELLS